MFPTCLLCSRPRLGKQVCSPSSLCGEPMGLAGCLALGLCAIAILTTQSTSYAHAVSIAGAQEGNHDSRGKSGFEITQR